MAGAEVDESWFGFNFGTTEELDVQVWEEEGEYEKVGLRKRWGIPIPARYKMCHLFFAQRDYFWRLGLCVPGGDPLDWGRKHYDYGNGDGEEAEDL